jgi:hypothetical protein
VTGGESGDASSSAMAKSMFDEASVTFTFPGKVVEANGATVDGNKATFDMLTVKDTAVQAKAEANAGIPMWIIWILIAVLVIAAALVLLFVLLRKRSARQEPALAGAAPYGQPGYAAHPGNQAQQDYPVQPGNAAQPGQVGYQPQPPAQNPQQDWAGQGYTPGAPPAPAQQPGNQPQPTQPPGQAHDDGRVPPPPSAPPASGA